MSDVRIGDVGVIFRLTVKEDGVVVDIATATVTKEIKFVSPNGTVKTKDATFTTDGTDGKLEYPSIAADLDECGQWRMQAHVALTGPTRDLHSSEAVFYVDRAL